MVTKSDWISSVISDTTLPQCSWTNLIPA